MPACWWTPICHTAASRQVPTAELAIRLGRLPFLRYAYAPPAARVAETHECRSRMSRTSVFGSISCIYFFRISLFVENMQFEITLAGISHAGDQAQPAAFPDVHICTADCSTKPCIWLTLIGQIYRSPLKLIALLHCMYHMPAATEILNP